MGSGQGLQDDVPLAPRAIAKVVMALDPMCLIHGVFFAEKAMIWPGQPKVARALTACVEATDVERAESGGVKRDHVRHAIGDGAGSSEGYGTIPFHRTKWNAGEIVASFSIDLAQISAYGLGEAGTDLLVAIARWKIRSLLDGGLRRRTACDLGPTAEEVVDKTGEKLPTVPELETKIRDLVPQCVELLGDGQPLDVVWAGDRKKAKAKISQADDDDS